MGLRLPIFPYYAAQGMPGVKGQKDSGLNKEALGKMQQFENYLTDPVVRAIAFNIIPPRGKQSIPSKGWFKPPVFDSDNLNHKGLATLMAKVGRHGAILVPDLTHIIGKKKDLPPSEATRELIAQFDIDDIQVLPLVLKLRGRSYDLRLYPQLFLRTAAPAPELFELMPEVARATVDYLKRYGPCGRRGALPRRQLVPARPHA